MNGMTEKMLQKSADMALEMTAKMFGMDKETVAKIVQVGMPMQMQLISENPETAKKMYQATFKMLPDEIQDFYRNLLSDPKLAEASKKQYRQIFGASAAAINAAAAAEVDGVTEEQVESVMGAMLPAFEGEVKAEAEAEGVSEDGFGRWMGKKTAE